MTISSVLRAGLLTVAIASTAGAAFGQQAHEVTVGLGSGSLVAAGPRIAQQMGFFAKHGIDAKFSIMDSANAATTAIISKSLNVAVSGPGELVVAQGRGQKVVAIANTYGGLGASLVLAKPVAEKLKLSPNAPVAERLKALDGLVLGSTTATSAYTVALKGAAQAVGATIRFAYMTQPAMPAALESGAIQGFFTSAPFWAIPVIKGTGVVILSGPKGEMPADNSPTSSASMQVMRDYAEANPEIIKGLVGGYAEFQKAIDERPADIKAAMAKLYPDLDAQMLDLLFASESVAWKAKPSTAQDMAREIAFVKSIGTALPQIDGVDPASMIFP
jgi:ABC-type nitrate/sulfonate/bicarbonate transport system substrate-binding protein